MVPDRLRRTKKGAVSHQPGRRFWRPRRFQLEMTTVSYAFNKKNWPSLGKGLSSPTQMSRSASNQEKSSASEKGDAASYFGNAHAGPGLGSGRVS